MAKTGLKGRSLLYAVHAPTAAILNTHTRGGERKIKSKTASKYSSKKGRHGQIFKIYVEKKVKDRLNITR